MIILPSATPAGKLELYGLIKEGLNEIAGRNTRPFSEAMADIRAGRRR